MLGVLVLQYLRWGWGVKSSLTAWGMYSFVIAAQQALRVSFHFANYARTGSDAALTCTEVQPQLHMCRCKSRFWPAVWKDCQKLKHRQDPAEATWSKFTDRFQRREQPFCGVPQCKGVRIWPKLFIIPGYSQVIMMPNLISYTRTCPHGLKALQLLHITVSLQWYEQTTLNNKYSSIISKVNWGTLNYMTGHLSKKIIQHPPLWGVIQQNTAMAIARGIYLTITKCKRIMIISYTNNDLTKWDAT